MKNPWILSLICSVVWSAWPIMAKVSKFPDAWISTYVTVIPVFVVVGFLGITGKLTHFEATRTQQALMIIAGIINAVGLICYGTILSSGSASETQKYVTIIMILIPIITTSGFMIVYETGFSWQKAFSLTMICVGIYFYLQEKPLPLK